MSSLPVRPSLSSLRKQAKSLLKGVRENDPESLARVNENHPKPDTFSTLRDAQLVVARRYGCQGWAELCEAVETALDVAQSLSERAVLFADLACLCYNHDENLQRRERAARLLSESPDLATSDIYAAAAAFDIEAVKRLVEADAECVNREGGPRNWTPLLYVAFSRSAEAPPTRDSVAVARLLLDAGADPNAKGGGFSGGWRWPALTGVIGEGENGQVQQPPHPRAMEIAELLLDAGAHPNDTQGLYNSMFSPGNEWLELFLSRGLTAKDRTDPDGDSPVTTLNYQLSYAAGSGYTERVALLLAHGADAAGKDDWYNGGTHLEKALQMGFGDIVDLLVEHGAPAPELTPGDRYRMAATKGDRATANQLLKEDASLRSQPRQLIDAAGSGRIDVVRLLLELGADPDELAGRGALHEAAWSGRRDVAKLLLDRGARLDIRDKVHDATPVGYADHAGRFEMRDFLLERTNDVFDLVWHGKASRLKVVLEEEPERARLARPDGQTPLHSVNTNGIDGAAVVDLLLEHGADINAKADDGSTPLSAAMEGQNAALVEMLKARGAKA